MWNPNAYGYPYQYEEASHYYEQDDIQEMMSRMHLNAPPGHTTTGLSEYSGYDHHPLISQLGSVSSSYQTPAPPPPHRPSWFDCYGFHQPMMPPYVSEPPADTATSSPAGATLELLPGRGGNGCAINAIACVLGKTYDEVYPYALAHGFTSEEGMNYRQMKNTIKALGGKAKIRYADEWAEVADLAIVSIRRRADALHAVVFERNDAGRFIYDTSKPAPIHRPDDLELAERKYLKIVKD